MAPLKKSRSWVLIGCLALGLPLASPAASQPVSEQLSPGASQAAPADAMPQSQGLGLVTVESDLQQADNVTGVVTASGNVKVVYPQRNLVATAREARYYTKEERIVLEGDVDVLQEGGNRLIAQKVTYLVLEDRLVADSALGDQVRSFFKLQPRAPLGGTP